MLALAAGIVLLAAPSTVSLAAPGLNAINLDPKLVQFYGDHLAQQLVAAHVSVMTSKDIEALLGLERQRQLLGCSSDETACITELAGALGADGLLRGDIAKVGTTWQINLKVLGNTAQLLASYSARTEDEEAVLGLLTQGARMLAKELYPKLGRGEAPAPTAATVVARGGAVKRLAWVPAAVALVFIGVGVVLQVLAEGEWARLHPAPGATVTLAEANRAAANGKSDQLWSGVLLSAGAACAAAAIAMFLFGGESASLTALLEPGGGTLGFAWVWP